MQGDRYVGPKLQRHDQKVDVFPEIESVWHLLVTVCIYTASVVTFALTKDAHAWHLLANLAKPVSLGLMAKPAQAEQLGTAVFGAGCFWGPELAFQRVPGVVATATGYSQVAELRSASHIPNPCQSLIPTIPSSRRFAVAACLGLHHCALIVSSVLNP